MNLTFQNFSRNELHDFLRPGRGHGPFNLPSYKRENFSNSTFVGFHYFNAPELCFSPSGDGKDDQRYLVAFEGDIIVGVISHGIYGYMEKHQGIAYVDVHDVYKAKGVATALIKELNNHLTPAMILHVSALSEEGKLCRVDLLFERYITVTKVRQSTY